MNFLGMSQEDAELGLRVMFTVAQANGALHPGEVALLEASARAFGVVLEETEAVLEVLGQDSASRENWRGIVRIAPGALAQELSVESRERVLQAGILMAIMDGEVDEAEIGTVEAFARALGVSEPRVHNLKQLAQGHVKLLWFDLARHSFARDIFEQELHDKGLGGVWKIVAPLLGMANNEALAQRFRATEHMPAGSLGRAYWEYLDPYGFGLPGEHKGVPETGVWHDITHVLSGYEATPPEEILVVCFTAGFYEKDPFFWIFTIVLQYHLGIQVSPYSHSLRGTFDPEVAIEALQRGAACKEDLIQWDYWPHMERPLEEVRAELGIVPRAQCPGKG